MLNGGSSGGPADYLSYLSGPVGIASQFASPVLGLLGSILGGPSHDERQNLRLQNQSLQFGLDKGRDSLEYTRKLRGLIQNRIGQSPLVPQQGLAEFERAMAGRFSQNAESAGRRIGLDSGVAQAGLAGQRQDVLANFLSQRTNEQAGYQQNLLQMLGGLV